MNQLLRTLTLAGLACTLFLGGCDKSEVDAAAGKAKSAATKTTKAVKKAAGDTKKAVAKIAAPKPAASADAAVNTVVTGIAKQDPQAVWNFLPASYQKDVSGLVQEFGGKLDAEFYDKGFATLGKLVGVLRSKKDFILKNPILGQMLKNPMLPPEVVEKNWDGIIDMLGTLASSEISKAAGIKGLNIPKFLAGTGTKLMKQGFTLAKAAGQDPVKALVGYKAELVKAEGDKATVKLISPDRKKPREEQFVKVEGKWITAEMAKEWKSTMNEARKNMGNLRAQMAKGKGMVIPMIAKVDGVLDKLGGAKTQADFDKALMEVIAAMKGM